MPSSFRVRCGGCRTKLEVRPEACGLTIPCPTCGKSLSVPATPPEPKPKPKPEPEAKTEIPARPEIFARKPRAPAPPAPQPGPAPSETETPRREEPATVEAVPAEATVEEPVKVEPHVSQPWVIEEPEMLVVKPMVEEPEMLVVEPEPLEAEPEVPVVQAWQAAPEEERPPEEAALLDMDLSEVGGEPVRKRRRDPDDDNLPSREKRTKKSQSEEDGPYWLQQRGLSDDQRGGRYEFNSTVIGGICVSFLGLVVFSAGMKFGFLILWGPIFIVAGLLAIWRGIHGE